MEFADLRPYENGDDVRAIDWNVTARTGIPFVRLYREERSRTLTLLADVSPSMTPAMRDIQIKVAALLSFAAVQSRDHVGLIAFTSRVEHILPPREGRRHALCLLADLMGRRGQGGETDFVPPLEAVSTLRKRPGMVVLLSDFHAPLPESLLRTVSGRHDLLALPLRDTAECDLPSVGPVVFCDAESGQRRLLHLSPGRVRSVKEAWEAANRHLAADLRRLRIDHAFLRSGDDPLPVLHAFFRARRGKRR